MSSVMKKERAGVQSPARSRSLATDVAICLSAAAALGHAVTTPDHIEWWRASGIFFAFLAVAQGWYAWHLFRNRATPWTLMAGIWGNVGVIVLYVVSRTRGLPGSPPIGAHGAPWAPGRAIIPGAVEGIGTLDVVVLVAELLLVVVLVGLLPARHRRHTTTALMWTGLAMFGLAALGVLA